MGKKVAPCRVVLDTNVLISALLFAGSVGRLRDLWVSGEIVPLVSRETFAEFRSALSYPKFKLTPREIAAIVNDEVLPFVEPVDADELTSAICRDPHDDVFLAIAAQGCATYLVTGDQDLLVLKKYNKTRIVTVKDFLEGFPSR
jgi:putative PIN family toxin of toxin-antitoxin system